MQCNVIMHTQAHTHTQTADGQLMVVPAAVSLTLLHRQDGDGGVDIAATNNRLDTAAMRGVGLSRFT